MMDEQRLSENANEERKARVGTTLGIWGISAGMMGICIPLSALTHTGTVIPLAVLGAAAVSSVAIWLRGGISVPRALPDESATQKQVNELEERLASIEAITRFEHQLLEAKYPSAEHVPLQAPLSPPSPVAVPQRASSWPISSYS